MWLGLLAGAGLLLPWPVFVAAVIVPMFPLYHVSALLQFLSEHAWLVGDGGSVRSSEEYQSRCWGRFTLEPLPARDLPVAARACGWIRWSLRTLLVHIPIRYGVLAGDLPAHDYHHLYLVDHDWTKVFWNRQGVIDRDDARGMGQREFCDLRAAIPRFSTACGTPRHRFRTYGRGSRAADPRRTTTPASHVVRLGGRAGPCTCGNARYDGHRRRRAGGPPVVPDGAGRHRTRPRSRRAN